VYNLYLGDIAWDIPEVRGLMDRSVRVFRINRSQAVRLPKGFGFEAGEVFVRRNGDEVVLSTRRKDWDGFLESELTASSGFMAWVEDLQIEDGAY
jgi:virulence-associated protein VagC